MAGGGGIPGSSSVGQSGTVGALSSANATALRVPTANWYSFILAQVNQTIEIGLILVCNIGSVRRTFKMGTIANDSGDQASAQVFLFDQPVDPGNPMFISGLSLYPRHELVVFTANLADLTFTAFGVEYK